MNHTKNKINDIDNAKSIINSWQADGQAVVFTNGCFDIIHLGHIDYLEKARAKGDKLVVAVNSDESVRKLKGESRPVNDERARSRMIAALSFVDLVIVFGEDTPYDVIKALLPNVLVKGNDYLAENIVGADIVTESGGHVETIELVSGYSTSSIIDKIRSF
ncbi:MAG: D-glycero-beta-D-manno-heptose 1-phosphate adenylyltransferase [Bacteroidota bacterium]